MFQGFAGANTATGANMSSKMTCIYPGASCYQDTVFTVVTGKMPSRPDTIRSLQVQSSAISAGWQLLDYAHSDIFSFLSREPTSHPIQPEIVDVDGPGSKSILRSPKASPGRFGGALRWEQIPGHGSGVIGRSDRAYLLSRPLCCWGVRRRRRVHERAGH